MPILNSPVSPYLSSSVPVSLNGSIMCSVDHSQTTESSLIPFCFLSQHIKLGLPNKPPVCSLFSVCTWMFCPNHHLCPLLKRESEKRKKKERTWSRSVISDPFVTPWAVACQELLSMEFSSLESWRGLPGPFLVPILWFPQFCLHIVVGEIF